MLRGLSNASISRILDFWELSSSDATKFISSSLTSTFRPTLPVATRLRHGRNAKPFVLRNRLSHLATPQIGKSVSIPPESRRGTYSNLHFLLSKEMRRYLASSRKFENVWWHLEITAPRSKLVSFRSNPFHSSIEVALAFAAYQTGAIVDAPADAWSTGHMPWCVGQSRCS